MPKPTPDLTDLHPQFLRPFVSQFSADIVLEKYTVRIKANGVPAHLSGQTKTKDKVKSQTGFTRGQ